MEALLILAVLVSVLLLCASVHLYVLFVSTLTQHRRTLHSVHQKIERERLRELHQSVVDPGPELRP